MKKIILLIILFTTVISCNSQKKIDLETISIGSKANEVLLKDFKSKNTSAERNTGYPYYIDREVDNYSYKGIFFIKDYPKTRAYHKSSIGIIVNNLEENIIIGYFITTYNQEEIDKIMLNLKSEYGTITPISVSTIKNGGFSYYYYKKTKDGLDILIEQRNGEGENGNSVYFYFIKSGTKSGWIETNETILENFISRRT